MRRRRLRTLVGVLTLLLLVPGLLALDSVTTALTHPERQTTVVEVTIGQPTERSYDPASAILLLNGLGRDISVEQANAVAPALGRFGRVWALEYGAVFDPDAAAERVRETFEASRTLPPWHLVVVASSMGDVRGLELLASLQQRHPDVLVEGFVVNTGPGPNKRSRVKGVVSQWVIDRGCSPVIPGRVTLGVIEVLNQAGQGNVTSPGDLAVAFGKGEDYRGRIVMDQLCSLTRPSALADPPRVPWSMYLAAGTPEADVIVDDEGAYVDWLGVLPAMVWRRVAGATHDNISYRPDLFNPLFADEVMPAIRTARYDRERPREPGPMRREP